MLQLVGSAALPSDVAPVIKCCLDEFQRAVGELNFEVLGGGQRRGGRPIMRPQSEERAPDRYDAIRGRAMRIAGGLEILSLVVRDLQCVPGATTSISEVVEGLRWSAGHAVEIGRSRGGKDAKMALQKLETRFADVRRCLDGRPAAGLATPGAGSVRFELGLAPE